MRDDNPLECRAGDHHGFASASQFQLYLDCPRKWGWPNLEGIRAPASPQQAFGTEMHALAERYLRDGVPIDLTSQAGLALMAGSHLLPHPGALDMHVEAHFALDLGGHEIHGFKDVELPGLVIDHKSTSDLAWAPAPEELAINVQACLYAYDNMLTYGGSSCELRWVYYRRNRPYQARAVEVRVTSDDIQPVLDRCKRHADNMAQIKALKMRALELPPNTSACGKYGGCHFTERCNISLQDRIGASMTQENIKASALNRFRFQLPAPPPENDPLVAAQRLHPGWIPGQPWWNGSAYVSFGEASYPQIPPPPTVEVATPTVAVAAPAVQVAAPTVVDTTPSEIVVHTAPPAETPLIKRGPGRPPGSTNKQSAPVEAVERVARALESVALSLEMISRWTPPGAE